MGRILRLGGQGENDQGNASHDVFDRFDFDHQGASAFYCSTHDLIRFGMFHLKNRLTGQKKILKNATLDLMHTEKDPGIPIKDNDFYALGWANNMDENGYHIVYHDGGMSGISTILSLVPSENIAAAVLLNCSDDSVYSICEDILCVMLPRYKENLDKSQKSKESELATCLFQNSLSPTASKRKCS